MEVEHKTEGPAATMLRERFEAAMQRRAERNQCPECGEPLAYKTTVGDDGDEIWQCPKCKELVVNP